MKYAIWITMPISVLIAIYSNSPLHVYGSYMIGCVAGVLVGFAIENEIGKRK